MDETERSSREEGTGRGGDLSKNLTRGQESGARRAEPSRETGCRDPLRLLEKSPSEVEPLSGKVQ